MATARTLEGRLFPRMEFEGGWRLSLQADRDGYSCHPRARFGTLEEYERVEAAVFGPFPHPVDIRTLGVSEDIASRFQDIYSGAPCIGMNLGWDQVEELAKALSAAASRPEAGVPRGSAGWSGLDVFTVLPDGLASEVEEIGTAVLGRVRRELIVHEKDARLAAEEAGGTVVRVVVAEHPLVLDLRNDTDRDCWEMVMKAPDPDEVIGRLGIQGVYDPSAAVLDMFSPRMLQPHGFICHPAAAHAARLLNP
jgi:hypothetical protein